LSGDCRTSASKSFPRQVFDNLREGLSDASIGFRVQDGFDPRII
jgi:hypothetical protein